MLCVGLCEMCDLGMWVVCRMYVCVCVVCVVCVCVLWDCVRSGCMGDMCVCSGCMGDMCVCGMCMRDSAAVISSLLALRIVCSVSHDGLNIYSCL